MQARNAVGSAMDRMVQSGFWRANVQAFREGVGSLTAVSDSVSELQARAVQLCLAYAKDHGAGFETLVDGAEAPALDLVGIPAKTAALFVLAATRYCDKLLGAVVMNDLAGLPANWLCEMGPEVTKYLEEVFLATQRLDNAVAEWSQAGLREGDNAMGSG
jgi:hypothetical protein